VLGEEHPVTTTGVVMTGEDKGEEQRAQKQRTRSIGIALGLALLVVLFYVATLVRLGPDVFNRAL